SDFALTCGLAGLALFCGAIALFSRRVAGESADSTLLPMLGAATFALVPFNGLFYAISAMETGLYLFLFMIIVGLVLDDRSGAGWTFVFGLLGGALFLTRPEGILVLPAYLTLTWKRPCWLRRASILAAGYAALALPWELFMLSHGGQILPTSGRGRVYGYIA